MDVTKFTLKQLTGISEEEDFVTADDSEQAKNSFNKRKEEIGKKIDKDIFAFSKIILEEKTLL